MEVISLDFKLENLVNSSIHSFQLPQKKTKHNKLNQETKETEQK